MPSSALHGEEEFLGWEKCKSLLFSVIKEEIF